jgi:hypothetical protein
LNFTNLLIYDKIALPVRTQQGNSKKMKKPANLYILAIILPIVMVFFMANTTNADIIDSQLVSDINGDDVNLAIQSANYGIKITLPENINRIDSLEIKNNVISNSIYPVNWNICVGNENNIWNTCLNQFTNYNPYNMGDNQTYLLNLCTVDNNQNNQMCYDAGLTNQQLIDFIKANNNIFWLVPDPPSQGCGDNESEQCLYYTKGTNVFNDNKNFINYNGNYSVSSDFAPYFILNGHYEETPIITNISCVSDSSSASSSLNSLMCPIVKTSTDMATTVIQKYWPYAIAGGLLTSFLGLLIFLL